MVGAGRRRQLAGASARRRARENPSPTSARRRAEKPRSSRSAGAQVTAVDRSAPRLKRLTENFTRLEPASRQPSPPTRRHGRAARSTPSCSMRPAWRPAPSAAIPTFPGSRARTTCAKLIALQRRLLDHAVTLLKPGGTLVYCTCSLEPEEGENAVAELLGRNAMLQRRPIEAAEVADSAIRDRRRRHAHPALPLAGRRFALCRPRRLLCRPADPANNPLLLLIGNPSVGRVSAASLYLA